MANLRTRNENTVFFEDLCPAKISRHHGVETLKPF